MAEAFSNEDGTGFEQVCKDAFDELKKASKDFKDKIKEHTQAAGIDLKDLKTGVDDVKKAFY